MIETEKGRELEKGNAKEDERGVERTRGRDSRSESALSGRGI